MSDTIANPPGARELRGASLCQLLHWLASGRTTSAQLTAVSREAIAARADLNAFLPASGAESAAVLE